MPNSDTASDAQKFNLAPGNEQSHLRIEVTVPVTLADEEAVLYEAARHRAVKALSDARAADQKAQHLKIFAEIMRLRRACCHPSLLLPDTTNRLSAEQLLGLIQWFYESLHGPLAALQRAREVESCVKTVSLGSQIRFGRSHPSRRRL